MKKLAAILWLPLLFALLFSACTTAVPYKSPFIDSLRRELSEQVEGLQSLDVIYLRPDLQFTCRLDEALTNQQIRGAIGKVLPLISAMAGDSDFQRELFHKTKEASPDTDFETYTAKKGSMPDLRVTFQIGGLGTPYSYIYAARFYDRPYNSGLVDQMQYDYYQTWSTEKLPTLPRETVGTG